MRPLILFIMFTLVAQAAPRTHFVRTRASKDAKTPSTGAFQTAAVRYRKPEAPVDVVLLAVVHLGEPRYFGRIQKLLAASDLVLYEAVQVGNDEHPVPATNRWADPASMFGKMLGLVHQASALDYHPANFVWADISLDELMDKGGQDLMAAILSGGPTQAAEAMGEGMLGLLASVFDPRQARAQLATVLAKSFDDLPAILGEQLSRPLIALRNKRLMEVVDRQLARLERGTLTVLFGAGHMPDLDRTLQARGYVPVETRWLSAWTY